MKNPFTSFRKPTLKAKLIKGGTQAKVNLINMSAEQTLILLYMTILQVAKMMRKDHRHIMNRLIDLDKQIIRTQKEEEREAKYGKKKKK